MRERSISATIIVIATLVCTVIGGWVFFAGALIVALLALDELMVMLGKAGHAPARLLGHLLVIVFFLVALTGASGRWLGEALSLAVIGPLLTVMLRRNLRGTMLDWSVSVAATIYIGWLAAHAVLLRNLHAPVSLTAFLSTDIGSQISTLSLTGGARWMLTAILVTWANDTFALLAGMAWGRRPLAPALSPKKTWEGAAGGLAAGVATMLACTLILGLPMSLPLAVAAGAALGVLGQLGDLAESLLKRQTGVKDTGNVIPGHGGVLDRIDSQLFVLPAIYYLATFITGS